MYRKLFNRYYKPNILTRYNSTTKSVDLKEGVEEEKLQKLVNVWWDANGANKSSHSLVAFRVGFIRTRLIETGRINIMKYSKPLEDVHILNVNCGGGLLCEPLARLGAEVVGIDPVEENLAVAKHHLRDQNGGLKISYYPETLEKYAQETDRRFDFIVTSDIIEDKTNVATCITNASSLLKPKGSLFLTAINRTNLTFWKSFISAEYLLGLPKGSYHWHEFVTIGEIWDLVIQSHMQVTSISGMRYNPFKQSWASTKKVGGIFFINVMKIPD